MVRRLPSKDLRDLVRRYEADGWRVSKTHRGHLRFDGPRGEVCFGPSTPSDWRSLANLEARLRRRTR